MERRKNRVFFNGGEKHKFTWITHINSLSELSSQCWSPRFLTSDKVEWKIGVWIRLYSGEEFISCTFCRMSNEGPSEVHYSVVWSASCGEKTPMDIGNRPPAYNTFRGGSAVSFRLVSVSDFKQRVGCYLSIAPLKLTVQIRLQRKSSDSVRPKYLSVFSEVAVWFQTLNTRFENVLRKGTENEWVREDECESENIPPVVTGHSVPVGDADSEENPWYTVSYGLKTPNSVERLKLHVLDVNHDIFASTEAQFYESGPQGRTFIVPVMKKEELKKEIERLSCNGEMIFRSEGSIGIHYGHAHVSRKCTFTAATENKFNLRNNLKQLHRSCPKSTNLKITAEGESFRVHKDIIAARSPVFRAMLSNNMSEKLSDVIEIEEIYSETLKNCLDYLYSGTFDNRMKWEDAYNLYAAAKQYFVQSLCHLCSRRLSVRISLKNCEQLLALSRLFEDSELQSAVSTFKYLNSS